MKRILFVGQVPETVDFSDPAIPPGTDAARIHAGIATGMKSMTDRGWQADLCLVRPEDAVDALERQLGDTTYDCVVVGAGLRVPARGLELFERLLNVIHRDAPGAAIAFNTQPGDTGDAAARWITGA